MNVALVARAMNARVISSQVAKSLSRREKNHFWQTGSSDMGKTLRKIAETIPLIAMVALNPLRWNLRSSVGLNFDKSVAENFSGIFTETSSIHGASK